MKAIIVDSTGPELTREEEALFAAHKPAGFILFQRHCVSKRQVRELVAALRCATGNPDAPILIDQEGGSVARLKAPVWAEYPAARVFGDLYCRDKAAGIEAATLSAELMGADLADMGIDVDCAPVLDVPAEGCHPFLAGSRTFGPSVAQVTELGQAVCDGLFRAGVTPVIKHIPGHGRGGADSHHFLPEVKVGIDLLESTDFMPFKSLAATKWRHALWAMAAHVVYSAIDNDSAGSVSKAVVKAIRQDIDFQGVLIADDISMKALKGDLAERVLGTMEAGMDLTMLCNGSLPDRIKALEATPALTGPSLARFERAKAERNNWRAKGGDAEAKRERLARLLKERNVA